MAPRSVSRGVEYWTDGTQQRIVLMTRGYHLISLDAKTGIPDPTFGKGGVVDLYEDFDQPTPKDGTISSDVACRWSCDNVVVVGAALLAGTAPRSKENTKGFIRGFDVRTRQAPVDVPHHSAARRIRQRHLAERLVVVHRQHAVLVAVLRGRRARLRVSAGRIGDGRFLRRPSSRRQPVRRAASCALDAKTGKRVWHQQLVHHDIWDYDIASPPTLINITVNGKPIRAVAQPTKQSYLFVFDRVTGTPVWPIEERPVPAGDTPGEWYSPTQPIPTKPAPYDRQGVPEDELIDFTPELNARGAGDRQAVPQRAARSRRRACGRPTASSGTLQLPGNQGSCALAGRVVGSGDEHAVSCRRSRT